MQQDLVKNYEATIRFGVETDSYDRTGEIVRTMNTNAIDMYDIKQNIEEMTGEIEQLPPMYSAKKVNGQRLYKLARQNKEVERKPVNITVYRAEIMNWETPFLKMKLRVSKGTYIRSYAHDLGKRIGCGAHLSELRRTAIGSYNVENAFRIPEFIEYWNRN